MVATVDELFQVIRSNPFIDGVGYFVEITPAKPLTQSDCDELSARMHEDFCEHAQATLEGEALGLDFHEHIFTQGEDSEYFLGALESILKSVENRFGVEHLCIEFQFDMARAKQTQHELDELLKP